jgi:hypothetical protein
MVMRANSRLSRIASLTLLLLLGKAAVCGQQPQMGLPTAGQRGPHDQAMSYTITNREADGTERVETHSYVQVETGLNYWNGKEWAEADPRFELARGYGILRKTQHRAVIAPNTSNPNGLVDLELPHGGRLVMDTAGIALTDGERSIWIGEIQESAGELISPRELLFRNAFSGISADILVKSSRGGIECDVIFREQITPAFLEACGMNPRTARLEVWHEVLQSPEGQLKEREIARANGEIERDNEVVFSGMSIGQGTAFLKGIVNPGMDGLERRVQVAKQWVKVEGFDWLIESAPYSEVAEYFQKLPEPQEARFIDPEAVTRAFALQAERAAESGRIRPARLEPGSGDVAAAERKKPRALEEHAMLLAEASAPNWLDSERSNERAIALANYQAGLVWDYVTINTSQTNYVFRGDTTYFVSGMIELYGVLTVLEGGAVIKMDTYDGLYTPYVRVHGGFDCRTSEYLPAVFTGKDDNTVGTVVSTGTITSTNRYGWINIYFDSGAGNPIDVHDIKSRYASVGIAFGHSRVGSNRVWNVQLYRCNRGIESHNTSVSIRNALVENCQYAMNGGASVDKTFDAEHMTIIDSELLFYHVGTNDIQLRLTNSLVTAMPYEPWADVTTNRVSFVTTSDFQTVGRGDFYLADGSPHRNAGSTNISTQMRDILRAGTTYPPILVSSHITTPTTWQPVVQRDTDAPDLGYHYPPLDYLASGINVSSTLTLTNGVAVGVYGAEGLVMGSGSKLLSEGSLDRPNRVMRYQCVQEDAATWGGSPSGLVRLAASDREIRLRYTEMPMLSGTTGSRRLIGSFEGGTYVLNPLALTDCRVFNGWQDFYLTTHTNTVLAFTNNLFQNCRFTFAQGVMNQFTTYSSYTLHLWNNLFQGGTNTFNYNTNTGVWTIKDNFFNPEVLTVTGSNGAADYNGYRSGLTTFGGSNNKTVANFDFQRGPHGDFYYPIIGTNLSILIDAGSRNATNAGLYHHTTVSGRKETNSVVDIGFHYPAVSKVRFVARDDSTQGNWKGVYGSEGGLVVGDTNSYPAYFTSATLAGHGLYDWTWGGPTDTNWVGYAQRMNGTNRSTWVWYTTSSMTMNMNMADDEVHRVALYCLDLGAPTRSGLVDVLDAAGRVLYDSQVLSNYVGGAYLSWDIQGSVQFRITRLSTLNPTLSAFFFDPGELFPKDDYDFDGLPDYWEDRNGNGAVDAGETGWQTYNSANGLSGSGDIRVFTPLK